MGCSSLNSSYIKQKDIFGHPQSLSIEKTEEILEQMKKSICKIKWDVNGHGTGFFCNIPFPNINDRTNLLPVLITNNHVIGEKDLTPGTIIQISLNNDKYTHKIAIYDLRKKYTNVVYDVTIIEITSNDYIPMDYFLELDNWIYNENPSHVYKDKSVYIMHYPNSQKVEYSLGNIKNISDDGNIEHYCSTTAGSSGAPILNLNNFKVFGVHKGTKIKKNWNVGTFIKQPLEDFIKFAKNNEALMKEKKDINNTSLKEQNDSSLNNKNKTTLLETIKNDNQNIDEIKKKDIPEREVTNEMIIKYKLDKKVKKRKELEIFSNCFLSYNEKKCFIEINGIRKKLCCILDLKDIELDENSDSIEIKLKEVDTITNMSRMFYENSYLLSLSEDSNWDTINVTNMEQMFYGCPSLISLPCLSKWNTKNVENMFMMFAKCTSLEYLPDISKWDMGKVTQMAGMFSDCTSLKSLADFSKWNTSNLTNMILLFFNCTSLISIPDISKWNISKVDKLLNLFSNCSSLISLPDISKWDTSNITDFQSLFYKCSLLKVLPEISKWDTSMAENMKYMFYECNSLESLPDISKWDISSVTNMEDMFYHCESLISLPDISIWDVS